MHPQLVSDLGGCYSDADSARLRDEWLLSSGTHPEFPVWRTLWTLAYRGKREARAMPGALSGDVLVLMFVSRILKRSWPRV